MPGDGGACEGGEFEEVLVYPLMVENKQNHLYTILKNVHNYKKLLLFFQRWKLKSKISYLS